MDLARKIGRLFSVPARNGELTPELLHHVRDNHAGGVIWFESTARATARVNAELQQLAEEPLLISADLEAGMGMRFTDTVWWPPAMALAATGDVALTEAQARATAIEARAIGVRHILAPVADVNVDPRNPVINTRSFGEDPHEVARHVAAFVRGVQSAGCIATAKHFPGHGDTHVDSHRALPVLDVTRERLERVELVPFRAAIEAGVRSVMIGHLAVPALDPTPVPVRAQFENVYGTHAGEVTRGGTMPASLSKPVIDLLRREFDGLVVSDAFDMGGLAAHFDPGEAAVRAIEAGIDQVLFSADTDRAIAAVHDAVRSGRIPLSRIDEAYERLWTAAAEPPLSTAAAKPPHAVEEIARRAITLVRDRRGLLPLTRGKVHAFGAELEPFELPDGDVHVILLASRPRSGAGKIEVPEAAKEIARRHPQNTVAVSFGSPYVLRELGDISTYVCAYGVQPVLQRAAARALRGEEPMTGRLPVHVDV